MYQNRKVTLVPLFVGNYFALPFQNHNSSYVASVVFDSVRSFLIGDRELHLLSNQNLVLKLK